SNLKFVQRRRHRAFGYEFKKELNFVFVGRRHDRIGALQATPFLVDSFDAKRRILSRQEYKLCAWINPDHPKIPGKIHTFRDASPVMLVAHSRGLKIKEMSGVSSKLSGN